MLLSEPNAVGIHDAALKAVSAASLLTAKVGVAEAAVVAGAAIVAEMTAAEMAAAEMTIAEAAAGAAAMANKAAAEVVEAGAAAVAEAAEATEAAAVTGAMVGDAPAEAVATEAAAADDRAVTGPVLKAAAEVLAAAERNAMAADATEVVDALDPAGAGEQAPAAGEELLLPTAEAPLPARGSRTIAAHQGPWDDGLGAASPWARMGTYCFNAPDHLPAAVAPRVLVGSVLHATAVHLLRSLGVTVVINCASADCRVPTAEYAAAGIAYHAFPARDKEKYPLLAEHFPTVHAILKPVLGGGHGRALVHCVAGRNRSATLAIAAVMLHERRPLAVVARRCFQRRPFILTNRSFRAQLVALADVHGLLHASEEPPDAGCSSEMLCSHCQQPHVIRPAMRLDGSLRVDARTFTVAALRRQLQLRFGCEHVNVDYETDASARDAEPPSDQALLPSAALMLPLVPFASIPLANLPVPIMRSGAGGWAADGTQAAQSPDALLTVFDTRRKSLVCLGVFDCTGHKGSALEISLGLN